MCRGRKRRIMLVALKLLVGDDDGPILKLMHKVAVSDLALIMLAATDESLAHEGINPHRISDNSRIDSLGFWRITGTG
jgi:hypothetical protein